MQVSSLLDITDPPENSGNFLDMLAATEEIRNRAEDDDYESPWEPAGNNEVDGNREIVESISVEQYDGYIPDDYQWNNVYIFRIHVRGAITRTQGASGDVDVDDVAAELAAIESIDGESGNTYSPSCSSGKSSYDCTLYYLSTHGGWVGAIGFTLRTDDVFCSVGDPGTYGSWSASGNEGTLSLDGQQETMTFDIAIAKNSC